MKTHARVVVIGGGAMGAGVLYHLVKEGWTDVVLLDKGELTSGSTFHAAGLIPNFIGSLNMAKIHEYAIKLYPVLEQETGVATGWHGCGAIRLAVNSDEVDWFQQVQGVLNYIGVESHLIGPNEIREIHPLMDTDGVLMGFHTPNDGHTDPSGITNSMVKGARNGGAEIYRRNRVLETNLRSTGEWEVVTEQGTIVTEHIVNACGCYAAQMGAMVGYKVPICNVVHQYLVTENVPQVEALSRELPVVRDPRSSCYYRQEQKGLLVGPYEMTNAALWGVDGVDWSFDMELLPPEIDRLSDSLEWTIARIPAFGEVGIKSVVSGPITHTPDGNFLLGPAPGLRNYWMAAGASIGITQGPGAGKYLAQQMVHGQTEINMLEFDPRRYGDWSTGNYLLDKGIDEYQQMYQVHYPGEYRAAGRPQKKSPIYDKLKAAGAVFAEVFGWERAKWFDKKGEGEKYSFRRANWFDPVAEECRAVRERVGIFDLTSYAGYDVTGQDAETYLNRICANRMPKEGGIILTHMLGQRGGIECEATITRLPGDCYFVLSAAVAELHDLDWLQQSVAPDEDVTIRNVTEQTGALAVGGPRARDTLTKVTGADLSNESFRWMRAQIVDMAGVETRALRVSYAGELGWELHMAMADMEKVYDALLAAGEEFGIVNFGMYAANVLRMEKGYKAWGSELTTEITTVEAGLDRFVKMDKEFIGRDVVQQRLNDGVDLKLVYVRVDADDNDVAGNEPVYDGDTIIGITTSGAYCHTVRQSLAFAYVEPNYSETGSQFDILLLGDKRQATVLSGPVYDPNNEKPRM